MPELRILLQYRARDESAVTIQIAQRIGRALNVRSATRLKELDTALREYVRSVPPGATLPISGSIDASQVVSSTFADARIAQSNVTQHEAALTIDWLQLDNVPATFTPAAHTHGNADLTGYTAADVLAKLLTVDGAGSGLDADLLDGSSSAAFAAAAHLASGTWTPADNSGASLAITVSDARYVKHDSLVIASAVITYPATVDTNQASISGLPFAVNGNNSSRQGYVSYSNGAIELKIVPNGSASTAAFYTTGGGTVTNAQMSSAAVFFQLIYQT